MFGPDIVNSPMFYSGFDLDFADWVSDSSRCRDQTMGRSDERAPQAVASSEMRGRACTCLLKYERESPESF